MSDFRHMAKLMDQLLEDFSVNTKARRCACCQGWFLTGEGVWAKNGYYIPVGILCGHCIEIRNESLALGM
jgi:hypothetical protein